MFKFYVSFFILSDFLGGWKFVPPCTNGFRSQWCKNLFANVRSIVNTGKRQGLSAFQSISKALSPLVSFFTPSS